ncbi:putative membrane protein YeiH [Nocardioides sp. HB32]
MARDTYPPVVSTSEPSAILVVFDLVGIFVFAISGALVAVRKGLDVFGVLVLAGTTGLGGGFLRDVLIDATPPAALADWRYLVVPVAAGLLAFFYHPVLGRVERSVNVLDAFGLGLFCVTGALKALDYGLGVVPAALMGMVTGIGGGMLRDLLAGRVPAVFRGELYATPALAGAVVVVAGAHTDLPTFVIAFAGGGLCVGWRLLALWRHWQAPVPTGPASV